MTSSQILAVSGILTGDRSRTRDLISYAVSLAGASGPARFCFIPTAEGDNQLVVQWFEDAFSNGLGWLPWSNGVHDDLGDQPRRTAYRQLVASGALPGGYATEDGVGLHYVDGALHEAVSVLPDARAWKVDPDGSGGFRETEIVPRYLVRLL
ncbi:hypothetical protein ACFPJ1_03420 [Kribbella qitaiheensis]|uniref:hypothetical protein n=1 Tax=Kribbella qitaiheensis TaxID=1544730 RepID=UPI00361A9D03